MTKIETLHAIREAEFNSAIERIPPDASRKDVLEIGSGTGFQLKLLRDRFENAVGIDLDTSNYKSGRVESIIEYDGRNIPFPDSSFDIVFSSHTLEHIPHLERIGDEIHRVLRDDGICVHILPNHFWRIWTSLTHYIALPRMAKEIRKEEPSKLDQDQSSERNGLLSKISKALVLPRHGERGNRFTEVFYFHPSWWTNHFRDKWRLVSSEPSGIFYTGYSVAENLIDMNFRQALSRILGSSSHVFVLSKQEK